MSHGKIVARLLLVTISSGMGMSVVYDWRDGPPGTEIMGLVGYQRHPNRSAPYDPKPAWNATRALSTALAGHEFVERVPVFQNGATTDDDWLLLFRTPSSSSPASNTASVVLVAWTSASFGQ